MKELLAQGEAALEMSDKDWGSEAQIDSENHFVQAAIEAGVIEQDDTMYLKATSQDMIVDILDKIKRGAKVSGKQPTSREMMQAQTLLNEGDLGDFFRGELGAPACDNRPSWVTITRALIVLLEDGIDRVKDQLIEEVNTL